MLKTGKWVLPLCDYNRVHFQARWEGQICALVVFVGALVEIPGFQGSFVLISSHEVALLVVVQVTDGHDSHAVILGAESNIDRNVA